MKRLIMMMAAAVTVAFGAWADFTETVGGYTWTYRINGGTAEIEGISPSPTGAVTIPSTLGGNPVTSIGYCAFEGCSGLKSVTIPDSVTSIEAAFAGCSRLTSVTIPASVRRIGQGIFEDCESLKNLVLPTWCKNPKADCDDYSFVAANGNDGHFCDLGSLECHLSCCLCTDDDVESEFKRRVKITFKDVWNGGGSGGGTIPAAWQKARTLTGLFGEGCGESAEGAEGTAQLKCGKANKKGIAKVSLTITPFVGRKRTYKAMPVDVSHGGVIEVSWPQQKYAVRINGDWFFGEPIYTGLRPACSPDAVWSANVGGSFTKTAYFNFGWIAEMDEGYWDDWWFVLTYLDGVSGVVDGTDVYNPVRVSMNGNKWTCPKATRLSKYKLCAHSIQSYGCHWEWGIDEKSDLSNVPALKLSYNAKTGIFKGSFNIYGVMKKKYTAKVTGVIVDGFGYGQASCSKISQDLWAVTIE